MAHIVISPHRVATTSLVPLSLMPYLSLVFLIFSEMLLMNFFISYSRGEIHPESKGSKGSLILANDEMLPRCALLETTHTVMQSLHPTPKAGPAQTPSTSHLVVNQCTTTSALNYSSHLIIKTNHQSVLGMVKPQLCMLGHFTSRYFSEPVSVNAFTKGGGELA